MEKRVSEEKEGVPVDENGGDVVQHTEPSRAPDGEWDTLTTHVDNSTLASQPIGHPHLS